MRSVSVPPPSLLRRLLAVLALALPLCVDPWGVDPLAWKRHLLTLLGLAALLSECLPALAGRRPLLVPGPCELVLLGLAGWSALSLTWATVPALGLPVVGLLLGLVGITRLWTEVAVHDGRVGRWVAGWLVLGLVAVALDAVAVRATADELSLANRKFSSLLFRHNNMAAGYASMLAPLAAAWALAAARPRRRVLGWALALAVVAYLIVLGSRAGLAASLLGTLVVVALGLARRRVAAGRPARWGPALAALVVLGAVLPLSSTVRGLAKDGFYRAIDLLQDVGLTDLKDAGFRMDVYRSALEMVTEAPLLGVGAGNFAVEHVRFDPRRAEIPHAHNDALQALTELGLPGLLLFLGLLGALVVGLRRALTEHADDRGFVLAAGFSGCLAVFVLTGLFEVPFGQGASAAGLVALMAWQRALDRPRLRWTDGARGPAAFLALVALALAGDTLRRLPASWWHVRAQRALDAGDAPAARAGLTALAALETGSHLPELSLADLAVEEQRLDDALRHFDRARRLWPYSGEVLQRQAEALLRAGQGERAVTVLEQALAQSPSDRELQSQLVRTLGLMGRLDEAIDRAEFMVQSDRLVSLDIVAMLARLWLRKAEQVEGPEKIRALVCSRHFHAVLLRDGPASSLRTWNREYSHLTHRLQTLVPGLGWWDSYDRMLRLRGWNDLPAEAVWTALDGSGQRLFPGWEEAAGPPLPRALR